MARNIKHQGKRIIGRIKRVSKRAGIEGREHIRENVFERIAHVKTIRLLVLEWGLLVLAITMLAITQAFWYTESHTVSTFTRGGTYTEATYGKINSLNPIFANTSSERVLSKLMFATLSSPDYSGHMGLDLAASITTDDSGQVWTVILRNNLKWSDNEPITTDDVLYTVSVLQNPSINTAYSSNLTGVKVTESNGAIIFTLPSAYVNFSSAFNFPILPAHILKDVSPSMLLEHTFSTNPVTSGPFAFNAVQAIGTSGEKAVYLSPNPRYYKGKPLLDSFVVHAYTDMSAITSAIQSGAATATAELLPTDADNIKNNNIYERQAALSSGVFAFFNTKNGLFNSKPLRQAVRQGLDMRSLRAPLGDELALDYPLLPNQIDISKYPELPAYDPDTAKSTITSVTDKQPIQLSTVNSGYLPSLAENLRFQLERLGFEVNLSVYEPGQDFLLTVLRPRSYDILLYEIELGADPDLFAYYHTSQANEMGLNLSNYSNALASDLLLAARGTTDNKLRATKYQSFLEYWVSDVPAIGIYQVNMSYYVNKSVRTFSTDSRLVSPIDRFADVYLWAVEKTTKNSTP